MPEFESTRRRICRVGSGVLTVPGETHKRPAFLLAFSRPLPRGGLQECYAVQAQPLALRVQLRCPLFPLDVPLRELAPRKRAGNRVSEGSALFALLADLDSVHPRLQEVAVLLQVDAHIFLFIPGVLQRC